MARNSVVRGILLLVLVGCSQPPPSTRSSPRLLAEADQAMLSGQWERAAGLYETFLSENPADAQRAEVRLQMGKCRLAAGRPEPAIRAFDQALNDQPPASVRWEILFRRAVAYRLQGDASRAVEGFRAVLTAPLSDRGRSVTNDELHYEYATALFRTGNFSTGQAELKLVSPTGPYERQLAPRLGMTGYAVQIGAYGNEDLARAKASELNAAIRQVTGSPVLFLVLVGNFPRYDDAQKELAKLQRQGYTEAFILP
ncbi:MAG: tetratricopeptide repeat protein [Planctomycetaceae bacterium]|nr:tetratricopeptide repeat protein [Planctomycetaceae bacterium]